MIGVGWDPSAPFTDLNVSIVRKNLMKVKGYTPYCGDDICRPRTIHSPQRWPRTEFNGKQFRCLKCGWESKFDEKFIKEYKIHWGK